MDELMTEREREQMERRLKVALALRDGWTYARIQAEYGVSSSTISSVKRLMREDPEVWKR